MKKVIAWILTALMLLSALPALAEEPVTIKVSAMVANNPLDDRGLVQDELNRLLAEKGYNFKIELVCIDWPSYATQISLMLADGSIDLFNMFGAMSIPAAADNEAVANMDELIQEYGQGSLDTMGPYMDTTTYNGSIYGAPAGKTISNKNCFIYNAEVARQAGFVAENVHDYESFTEELKKVKATFPDMTVISTGVGGMYFYPTMDTLGNNNYYACIILDENAEPKIVNYYETEYYKKDLAFGRTWAENGFFKKDAINGQDAPYAPVGDGVAFGVFAGGPTAAICQELNQPMFTFELGCVSGETDAWATTSNATGGIWCIAELSDHKVEAMQFLNLLYVDKEIIDVVCNGIEGVHYMVTEEGNITYANDQLNSMTVGWPVGSLATYWPNLFPSYPVAPMKADAYQKWADSNENCKKSPAFGFAFDSTEVSDQIAACNNVCDKYLASLMLDIGDTDALLDAFLQDLKNAGVDDIIAEKQAQLDAWLAK